MQKATVTYHSPVGDSKVVEMGGVTFFDGQSKEINSYDNPHLLSKLKGNAHFEVALGKEDDAPPPKVKRGRPSKADIEAAKVEADRAEKEAKDAADRAEAAKSDHEKLANAPETEVVRPPAEGQTVNLKTGVANAGDHDFESDRRKTLDKGVDETDPAKTEKSKDAPMGFTGTSPKPLT